MHEPLTPAAPVEPPAPYVGGKKHLAQRIIALLGDIPHTTYVEPFIGMGGVFLRRPFRAKAEVINDISADVATLFRILQRHYVAFMDMLRWQVTSRAEFERLVDASPDSLTDLDRAARFLYLQRLAFGGKITHRAFGVSPATSARFNVATLGPVLEDVHARLSGVIIEKLPYPELIARYDTPETLFYLDPPYWGSERDYGRSFGPADFTRLAGILREIKGTFVMPINDVPEIRDRFSAFELETVATTYSIAGGVQPAAELLISPRGQQRRRLL